MHKLEKSRGAVQDLLLKPLLLALILATVASLMLCCRPSVRRRVGHGDPKACCNHERELRAP